MAAPAWNTNLNDFYLEGSSTVSALGGGASALSNPETDYFIQGSDCISKGAWTNDIKGFIVDGIGTTFTLPTDGGIIFFAKYDAAGSLATKSAGGFQSIIGSASNAYEHYYIGGSDTLAFTSWYPYIINPSSATSDNTTGSPSGLRWVGILANLPTTSGPTKGNPIAIDAIRYGRCDIEYTGGDGTFGYNTFEGAEAYANSGTTRWGLIQNEGGTFQIQGFHSLGTTGSTVDFRDSNKVLFWRPLDNNSTGDAVSSGFNRMEILNSGSNVDWENITIQSLSTVSKGTFVHTAGTFDATNCQFVDMGEFTFITASTVSDTTFRRCEKVDIGGGTFDTCLFTNSTASASTTTTNLEDLTDCTFVSDGSNHAVELTSLGSGTMNWNNFLSGYVASPSTGSTGNEAIFVNVASGNLTINVNAGYTTPSIRTAGANVTTVAGQVTTTITVRSIADNSVIQGARVYAIADSGGTLSAGTEIIQGLTDVNGQISDTRSLSTNQPITGWVRKSTTSPLYVTAPIVGTINNASGLDLTILMISDE